MDVRGALSRASGEGLIRYALGGVLSQSWIHGLLIWLFVPQNAHAVKKLGWHMDMRGALSRASGNQKMCMT